MKIRMLKTAVGDVVFRKGGEYDLPKDAAMPLVYAGHAEVMEEERQTTSSKPAAQRETATKAKIKEQ